jgi:hypothetical protein
MDRYGHLNLDSYSKQKFVASPNDFFHQRGSELVSVVNDLLEPRLGPTVAKRVAQQLLKHPIVSTADHHGPIDHPFFVNTNILASIPLLDRSTQDFPYSIAFSFSGVSVNNTSAFPRGLLVSPDTGSTKPLRIPILPDRVKMSAVYGTRAYTAEEVERARHALRGKGERGELDVERASRLDSLVAEVFASPEVLAQPDLLSQITVLNYQLWPRLFHAAPPPKQAELRIPGLIYLDIESVVTEVFLRHHLSNPSSPLHTLVFDQSARERASSLFDGIQGAFSREQGWGTFVFWGLNEHRHRVALQVDRGCLVSKDGTLRIPLTEEAIRAALVNRDIFPSMLLAYVTTALYYGVTCLGGFSQVYDLTQTKASWMTFLREFNFTAEAAGVASIPTDLFGGDGAILAYRRTPLGEWYPASGLDLAVDPNASGIRRYVDFARVVSLAELMEPMLPEVYSVLYSEQERDPELATLDPKEIIQTNGLLRRIEEHFGPPTDRVKIISDWTSSNDDHGLGNPVSIPVLAEDSF